MDAHTIETFKYLSIPVIASLVGWSTNWLAIKLAFWPVEFIGIKKLRLGWQGIVPMKAHTMAGIAVDSMLSKLGSLSEVIEYMDPEKVARHIVSVMEPQMSAMIEEVMLQEKRILWENLPVTLKNSIDARIKREMPHKNVIKCWKKP